MPKEQKSPNDIIQVPRWVLENMFRTLEQCNNIYHIAKRESCLHRQMMRDWHYIGDLLKTGEINHSNHLTYYMGSSENPPSYEKA